MDQFKAKFLEEASDLIEGLEKLLFKLEGLEVSNNNMEEIFRVMHTIKGSSFMFGFDKIGEFTHNLETIYDQIRNKERIFTNEILDTTLASVDHIRTLLSDSTLQDQSTKLIHENLSVRIKNIIGDCDSCKEKSATQDSSGSTGTYYILFKPQKSVLKRGYNPNYLLQDLSDLGTSKVVWHFHNIPEVTKMDVEESYVYWEIFLSCTVGMEEIKDVFMFVEDDSEIVIKQLSSDNLFLRPDFTTYLEQIPVNQPYIDLEQVLEMFALPAAVEQHLEADPIETGGEKKITEKDGKLSSIRVSSDKLENLMNLVSELVTTQARLSLFAQNNVMLNELHSIAEDIEKISRQLRDNTLSICLIRIDTLITRFRRMIRDTSRQIGKDISFVVEGAETEIDKTIIDIIADPLMHILRNSMDHGIESTEDRLAKGKPAKGTITLRAFYSGTNVHIEISDDGGGIDLSKVREKAINKGLISPDIALSERELLDLIFLPGFSTASAVSELSGRGVGMDVVKRHISSVRGVIEIQSTLHVGTTMTIKLPLTLSIIDGLLVQIGAEKFLIPVSMILQCYEIKREEIQHNADNLLQIGDQLIPFLNLRSQFNDVMILPEIVQVVVVEQNGKNIGILVDSVISECQAVLKPLGILHRNNESISGATILGDGTIALVLDINRIIKSLYQRKEVKVSN